jgi:hypothetical protein
VFLWVLIDLFIKQTTDIFAIKIGSEGVTDRGCKRWRASKEMSGTWDYPPISARKAVAKFQAV